VWFERWTPQMSELSKGRGVDHLIAADFAAGTAERATAVAALKAEHEREIEALQARLRTAERQAAKPLSERGTVEQVAAIYGVSVRKVQSMAAHGESPERARSADAGRSI
jgi:hypothetical protein